MRYKTFLNEDPHGKKQLGGTATPKRERELMTRRRLHMHHRSRNGAYDPVTYYHVLEQLLHIQPGEVFKTRHFIDQQLNPDVRAISWDGATVGRIINDLAETLQDAYGFKIISANRRFDGTWFDISGHPKARAAMERLLEDLSILANNDLIEEDFGRFSKRMNSPLERCPSVNLHDLLPEVQGTAVS